MFFSKISSLIVASGTSGSWTILAVILIIYGWFKYIKPFLDEWEKIRRTIIQTNDAYNEFIVTASDVIKAVNSFNSDSGLRHKTLMELFEKQESDFLVVFRRDVSLLKEKIKNVHDGLDKHTEYDISKLNDLMVELTKINLRLEMSNSVGQLRGMK